MRRTEHLTQSGVESLVRLAYGMNANGKQRARSSEQVLRWVTGETAQRERLVVSLDGLSGRREHEVKIQSDPHGDMGSQAEMTWPLEICKRYICSF